MQPISPQTKPAPQQALPSQKMAYHSPNVRAPRHRGKFHGHPPRWGDYPYADVHILLSAAVTNLASPP